MSDLTKSVLSQGLFIPSGTGGSYPDPSDVRFGVEYHIDVVGTCYVPTADEVLDGVLVDATVGNVVLPIEGNVLSGVHYGPDLSLVGTLSVNSGGDSGTLPTFDFDRPNGFANNPLAAQQPAPSFANDNAGYWASLEAQNRTTGLAAVLPAGTIIQADIAIQARQLDAQISWRSTSVRWKGAIFQASISDADFSLILESGGDTQQGRITLVVSKLQFSTKPPGYNETLLVQAMGSWHEYTVAEMQGQNDDKEMAITYYLEKSQNDQGN